jgi:prepilin-type processing-associated H-X9-DG protein
MKRTTSIVLLLLCLMLCAASLPAAEPLADRLPPGTLVYVGWAGDNKALDDSLVGKLLQEPGFAKMFERARVALAGASRDARPLVESAWDLGTTAVRHPIALALVDLEVGQDEPTVSAVLLIDLGADRKDFAQKLDALIEKAGMKLEDVADGDLKYRQLPSPAGPVSLGYLGDTLFLSLGRNMPKVLAGVAPGKGLAADKAFADAMKAVSGPDLQAAFYLDAAALMKRAQTMLEPKVTAPGNAGPGFSQVLQSLGVANLRTISGALCVTDGLFHTKVRLASPAPHRGVLLPFAGEPLSDADLAALPEDTDFLAAAKFSAEGLYDEIRRIVKELSPDTDAEITREMMNPKGLLGALALKDLLGSLGQTWTFSCADSYGGSLTGLLLTAEVKDANRFAAASARLEALLKPAASKPADAGFRISEPPTIRTAKSGEVEAHYVAFSGLPIPVAPAWAVYKGRLYVAAWPQIIFAAIDNQAKAPLLKKADFAQMRARLGSPSILLYINTPRMVRQGYGVPLALWTMGASMMGPAARADWLPPLSVVEKYVRPEMSSVSSDQEGITIEGYGTIPGLATAPVVPALGVAVLMPALSKARFHARKASSMSNLSAIGKGIAIWSTANKDQFPPDFAALVADGQSPNIFVSPLSQRPPPKLVNKNLVGETDYIYLQLDSAAPADLICAYERPENHNNQGTNVLYADLHVGYLDMNSFQQTLKKSQEYARKRAAK